MINLLKQNFRTTCFLFFTLSILTFSLHAKTIIVDKTGLGNYTTIQAAINAALPGDTVIVFPGIYNEQVNVGKDIVLQGSGYEYTRIVANSDPALSMSSGKVMWLAISSNIGSGVGISGGILTNCVVWNCAEYGITYNGQNALVQNCNIIDCNNYAVYTSSSGLRIINSIMFASSSTYAKGNNIYPGLTSNKPELLYSRLYDPGSYTGCINSNPGFPSETDFKINSSSPCWDKGKPDLIDPDGSRSDMGYYGGADAPVYPVVTDLRIYLNPDGTVNIQATAQSTY